MRILVGYDGSECSRHALEDLTRAGLPAQAEVCVLGVADMWPVLPNPEDEKYEPALAPDTARAWQAQLEAAEHDNLPEPVRRAHEYALQQLEQLRLAMAPGVERLNELFPAWTIVAETVADSPYWGLVKRAETWEADLLFVGSHGRSALGRIFLGSVSQNVLSHAPCSVRMAHCRQPLVATEGPLRLVVAVDGSADAFLAVSTMAERRWPEGSTALVLGVVEPKHATLFAAAFGHEEYAESEASHEAWLHRECEKAGHELGASGLNVELREIHGDPKELLVSETEQWQGDVLFLGAQGHRRAGPATLGTVANAVVSRVQCSVEVVRPRR